MFGKVASDVGDAITDYLIDGSISDDTDPYLERALFSIETQLRRVTGTRDFEVNSATLVMFNTVVVNIGELGNGAK